MSKFDLNINLGGIGLGIRKIFCQHPVEQQSFVRNIYGDEINHAGGMRSIWVCRGCGKQLCKPELLGK